MDELERKQTESRPDQAIAAALEVLRAKGIPVTDQRRQLVEFVLSRPKLFTPEELLEQLQRDGIKVGRATVFRNLDLLERIGFVGRVTNGGHLSYVACITGGHDHHHHLMCSQCGQVFHFDDCPLDEFLERLHSTTGFRIQGHNLEIAGICPACQN